MRDSDIAYEKIKKMLITCELKPGEVIIEPRLTEQINVGRTPVREALKRLSWEKLICIIPRQCMIVSKLSVRDLESICQLRYTLSALVGRLAAARRTGDELRELRSIADKTRAETIPEKRILLGREFHRAVSKITRNEYLETQMNITLDLCVRQLFVNREYMGSIDDTVVREYGDIIRSIEKRDEKETTRLLQGHVMSFKSKFLG